jgi:hypothetical protein
MHSEMRQHPVEKFESSRRRGFTPKIAEGPQRSRRRKLRFLQGLKPKSCHRSLSEPLEARDRLKLRPPVRVPRLTIKHKMAALAGEERRLN